MLSSQKPQENELATLDFACFSMDRAALMLGAYPIIYAFLAEAVLIFFSFLQVVKEPLVGSV